MKDIAHREISIRVQLVFEGESETSSRVIRDEGENLCGVILSSRGACRNIDLQRTTASRSLIGDAKSFGQLA